ncbi:MAG: hypothetical protein PHE88_08340 [Elusimicrobia bacterium]|nr:hypothetical protein [Elusimicrobiota bacterium]
MQIKNPKCEVYFYGKNKPSTVFDLKDVISILVKSAEKKKNVEFVKLHCYDEQKRKISCRLDFGSITVSGKSTRKRGRP